MMTTEDEHLFVDTNILVFANVIESPLHEKAYNSLQKAFEQHKKIWINRQVLREYLVVMTRPQTFPNPLSIEKIISRIEFFESIFMVANETEDVTRNLLEILKSYSVGGKNIHDTNIIATMQTYGITTLLTHNINDFSRFEQLIKIKGL